MARLTKSKTIDGLTFTVTQLPGMRGALLSWRLGEVLGPALLRALSGVKDLDSLKPDKLMETDVKDLGKLLESTSAGVEQLMAKFRPADLEALIRELCDDATVTENGQEMPLMRVFDLVMAGRPATVFKLIQFALEVNFQDFFGGVLARVMAMRKASPSKA